MKKSILLSALLLITPILFAQKSPVFITDGKALRGYDAVAFFMEGKPVKGSPEFSFTWMEAVWLFASRENLDLFSAAPEKYAPQYGGYCAFGTAEGHKAPTQIETWTIVDGKLYLNYNNEVKRLWLKNQPELIGKADKNWPLIKNHE